LASAHRSEDNRAMDQIALLEYSLAELRNGVDALDDADFDIVSNCDPWTVRQLASHAWDLGASIDRPVAHALTQTKPGCLATSQARQSRRRALCPNA
jgi:hypothetical protein